MARSRPFSAQRTPSARLSMSSSIRWQTAHRTPKRQIMSLPQTSVHLVTRSQRKASLPTSPLSLTSSITRLLKTRLCRRLIKWKRQMSPRSKLRLLRLINGSEERKEANLSKTWWSLSAPSKKKRQKAILL